MLADVQRHLNPANFQQMLVLAIAFTHRRKSCVFNRIYYGVLEGTLIYLYRAYFHCN